MNVELTEKQAEYIVEAHHRWNFAVGAVRSGKSHLAVQYTIPNEIRKREGLKGLNLILGASKENIERNVLEPMRVIWGNNLVSDINSRNWAVIFGEKVYCIGAEKINQVTKIRGSEIKFAYIDEATDINKEVFEMLKSRLSLPYSICHAACNPSYPNHFIKEFLETVDRGVDIYCQEYTIYDNPFLPKEYVRSLEAEYAGTVYFSRYILGKWARAEGLIYPMYMDALVEPPVEPAEQYEMSVDYGTQNAFACILWGKYGDKWVSVDEYYYSGRETGKPKTDDEYGEDLERFVSKYINIDDYNITDQLNIYKPVMQKIKIYIDPSAASFIALMRKKSWCKVVPANNDVADGIRETASAMQRGIIKISNNCKNWVKEVSGYVWDDTQDDKPIKENDHLMDSMRYFVKTKRLAKNKSNYVSTMYGG